MQVPPRILPVILCPVARYPMADTHVRVRDHRWSSEVECRMIKGKILRVVVLVAGVTGLLALFETVAHAGTNLNHCEPLQRI